MADGIRIDDLDPTVLPSVDHLIAAMKDGLTVKLSIAQVISLIRAINVPWDDGVLFPAADNLKEVIAALDQSDEDIVTAVNAAISSAVSGIKADPWALQPIGVPIGVQTHVTGVGEPPTNQAYRFIKLTAGLTGSGQYNNGVLTGESVSGSAPTVVATAGINLAGSPLIGQTVRLLNSEQRFLRAHTTSGNIEDSANLAHTHSINDPTHTHPVNWSGSSVGADINSPGSNYRIGVTFDGALNNNPLTAKPTSTGITRTVSDGGTEARPRNMGVTYYMRVK